MIKVISIGRYNSCGKFVSNNWYEVLTWLKVNCDSLIIYCHIEYEIIYKKFNHTCNINIMETPDKDMNVQSYEFNNFKSEFWNVIKEMDFCIDSKEDVSHLFFMYKEQLLCMLEVTDFENYMLIYYINNNINYSGIISNCRHNKYLCNVNRYDIDDMADGEEWKPY